MRYASFSMLAFLAVKTLFAQAPSLSTEVWVRPAFGFYGEAPWLIRARSPGEIRPGAAPYESDIHPRVAAGDAAWPEGGNGRIAAIALSPDGGRCALVSTEGVLVLYDTATSAELGRSVLALPASVAALSFDPTGSYLALAVGSSPMGTPSEGVVMMSATSGKRLWRIGGGWPQSLAWSPDGKVLAFYAILTEYDDSWSGSVIVETATGRRLSSGMDAFRSYVRAGGGGTAGDFRSLPPAIAFAGKGLVAVESRSGGLRYAYGWDLVEDRPAAIGGLEADIASAARLPSPRALPSAADGLVGATAIVRNATGDAALAVIDGRLVLRTRAGSRDLLPQPRRVLPSRSAFAGDGIVFELNGACWKASGPGAMAASPGGASAVLDGYPRLRADDGCMVISQPAMADGGRALIRVGVWPREDERVEGTLSLDLPAPAFAAFVSANGRLVGLFDSIGALRLVETGTGRILAVLELRAGAGSAPSLVLVGGSWGEAARSLALSDISPEDATILAGLPRPADPGYAPRGGQMDDRVAIASLFGRPPASHPTAAEGGEGPAPESRLSLYSTGDGQRLYLLMLEPLDDGGALMAFADGRYGLYLRREDREGRAVSGGAFYGLAPTRCAPSLGADGRPDGGLFALACEASDRLDVVRLDPTGEVLWTARYRIRSWVHGREALLVHPRADGGVLVSYSDPFGVKEIARLAPDGAVVWAKGLRPPAEGDLLYGNFTALGDGAAWMGRLESGAGPELVWAAIGKDGRPEGAHVVESGTLFPTYEAFRPWRAGDADYLVSANARLRLDAVWGEPWVLDWRRIEWSAALKGRVRDDGLRSFAGPSGAALFFYAGYEDGAELLSTSGAWLPGTERGGVLATRILAPEAFPGRVEGFTASDEAGYFWGVTPLFGPGSGYVLRLAGDWAARLPGRSVEGPSYSFHSTRCSRYEALDIGLYDAVIVREAFRPYASPRSGWPAFLVREWRALAPP